MTSVSRLKLVAWLDEYLGTGRYIDISQNGLQVEGKETVSHLAVAVDASLKTLCEAVGMGADMLITHHGLFWGRSLTLTGPHAKKVRAALLGDLNLYVSHIPLDAHPEVGNNIMIAQGLGLHRIEPFGQYKNTTIGFWGELPFPQDIQTLADRIQKLTGEICLVHGGGPTEIQRIGIISGAASDAIPEAAALGLDCFITGEPKHASFHDSFEYGINTIYAGHYETETFGIKALAYKIKETFHLPWTFIDCPTGL